MRLRIETNRRKQNDLTAGDPRRLRQKPLAVLRREVLDDIERDHAVDRPIGQHRHRHAPRAVEQDETAPIRTIANAIEIRAMGIETDVRTGAYERLRPYAGSDVQDDIGRLNVPPGQGIEPLARHPADPRQH